MENKQETLNNVYEVLLAKGKITGKKGFAALLGVNYSNLVAAMNGNPKALTDSLVAKALQLIPGDTPPQREKSEMEKAIEALQSSNLITLKAQEQTDRLISLLELQMGVGKKKEDFVMGRNKKPRHLTATGENTIQLFLKHGKNNCNEKNYRSARKYPLGENRKPPPPRPGGRALLSCVIIEKGGGQSFVKNE